MGDRRDTHRHGWAAAWGFTQGLTRLSQTIPYANIRTALDRSAGRILMLAG